jgi:hypothetical protein
VRALRSENAKSRRGPAWRRLPPLRESALRYASAWIYARKGWRTPRWRTLQQALPVRAVKQLRTILDLPEPSAASRALTRMKRTVPLPDDVQARIRAGEWEEAVLLARRHLERDVANAPRTLVESLQEAPALNDVERTRAEVRALVDTLKVGALFPPSLRSRLPRL